MTRQRRSARARPPGPRPRLTIITAAAPAERRAASTRYGFPAASDYGLTDSELRSHQRYLVTRWGVQRWELLVMHGRAA
jgi:hypothetical protein